MARRIAGWVVSAVATILLTASVASANFHLMAIREIFPGTTADPNAQYVMLQMYTVGQNVVVTHGITVHDATGGVLGTFTFPGNVANGSNQATILIATSEAATLFGVTADLAMTAVIPLSAGAVCFDGKPDCVSWGNFTGDGSLISPAGTPFNAATGLQIGHAIRRDISAGNPTLLEGTDDTNNSANDFDCADTAHPINNAGADGTYTDATPCPPQPTATITPTQTPTPIATPSSHDAVVLPVRPALAKIPADTIYITKKLKVGVRNGDAGTSATIQLTGSGCPGTVLSTPDFDRDTAGEQDTVTLDAGKSRKATVFAIISRSAFTSFNAKSPQRCVLTFQATVVAPANVDPTPENNIVKVEIDVRDLNDPNLVAAPEHESVAVSVKPLNAKIKEGELSVTKTVNLKVVNADDEPGHQISVALGPGTCPALGLPDFDDDAAGVQSSISVDGGKKKTGKLVLTLNRSDFNTTAAKSPARCVQQFCVSGPMGNTEPNPSNDCTELTIDVIDENDF